MHQSPTAAVLGKIGTEIVPRNSTWDAIIVGAGHNGLVCAAYLAKAGKKVLVLEKRDRVGGACTLEEPWPQIRFSPCAYVIGLLHPKILRELELKENGFRWKEARAGMFVPFWDGTSVQLWGDSQKCEEEIGRLFPGDLEGWKSLQQLKREMRDAIRPDDETDIWLSLTPTRAEIETRVKHIPFAKEFLFTWSMGDLVEHFFKDEKLQLAYMGQGVIGTNASPFDPGTAYIYFHHASGRMDGLPGTWGYVEGGMGMVSFILTDICKKLEVTISAGSPVARMVPGEGVELANGDRFFSPTTICNADGRTAISLLGENAEYSFRRKVESIPVDGCTVKVNFALRELPNYKSRPGSPAPHHYGQINTPLSKKEWHESHRLAKAGKLPSRVWTEQYFHSVYDQSVAPNGIHTMSVFAQYVPSKFQNGSWDSRREEAGDVVVDSISDFCDGFKESILHREVLGPKDVEARVGLTGGHIFQGECLPQYMWEKRLSARTPMKGFYLCGAATHPGGSVIGINGYNAALAVLQDQARF